MPPTNKEDYAAAEEYARAAGYDLPIAWALGFLVDHEFTLRALFNNVGDTDKAEELWRMIHEIKTGEIS